MEEIVAQRQEKLYEHLNGEDIKGLVLTPGPEMGYLSGFQYKNKPFEIYLLLSPDKEPVFVVPKMMAEQVKNNSYIEKVLVWSSFDDIYNHVSSYFESSSEDKIMASDHLYRVHAERLENNLNANIISPNGVLDQIIAEKHPKEIENLKEAGQITEKVIEEIRSEEITGKTEKELADLIVSKFRENGGQQLAFPPIVAAGENGAEVLHRPQDKVIEEGVPVVIDVGTTYNDYLSDYARTIVFDGEPSEEFKEIFNIVEDAYQKGLEKIKPGNTAGEVDEVSREIIEDAGYGDQYITSGGHGIGRSTGEPPYIKRGNNEELKPGMVLTFEPGIYLPGKFGAKIENTILVTETGYELLNKTSTHWKNNQ